MTNLTMAQKFSRDGYYVMHSAISPLLLAALQQRFCDARIEPLRLGQSVDSGVMDYLDLAEAEVANLVAWPELWRRLTGLKLFTDPRLHSFYLTAKPPHSAAMDWHRDVHYGWPYTQPPEFIVLVYLDDTTPLNGCLRVLPGSQHGYHATPPNEVVHATAVRDGEIELPVTAGSAVVLDRRVLHATKANTTNQWRRAVSVAWVSNWRQLVPELQHLMQDNPCWQLVTPAKRRVATTIRPELANVLPFEPEPSL